MGNGENSSVGKELGGVRLNFTGKIFLRVKKYFTFERVLGGKVMNKFIS
jgi:hypothetical protein